MNTIYGSKFHILAIKVRQVLVHEKKNLILVKLKKMPAPKKWVICHFIRMSKSGFKYFSLGSFINDFMQIKATFEPFYIFSNSLFLFMLVYEIWFWGISSSMCIPLTTEILLRKSVSNVGSMCVPKPTTPPEGLLCRRHDCDICWWPLTDKLAVNLTGDTNDNNSTETAKNESYSD